MSHSMPFVSLGGVLSLIFVMITGAYLGALSRNRLRDPTRALLVSVIYFTYGTLHWVAQALLAFTQHNLASGLLGSMEVVFAAVSLWAADNLWDRWNRRRKKKGRSTGKVGVRLGKLVIIPDLPPPHKE